MLIDTQYPLHPLSTLQAVPGVCFGQKKTRLYPGTFLATCQKSPNSQARTGFPGGYIHYGYVRVISVVDIPNIQLHPPTTIPSSTCTSKQLRKQGASISSSQPPSKQKGSAQIQIPAMVKQIQYMYFICIYILLYFSVNTKCLGVFVLYSHPITQN